MPITKRFESKYGYFTQDGLEYVLTRPDPPRPWVNYMGNATYAVRFSQTGGGTAKHLPPDGNVINPTSAHTDRPGRYVYIRDNDTGKFWTTNWMPVQAKYEHYQCRHGLGYSEIESTTSSIYSSLHVFVPVDEVLEIWTMTIENRSEHARRLSVFPFMELLLAGYTGAYDLPISSSRADWLADEKLILGQYDDFATAWHFEYFVHPVFDVDGYDCRREDFIGMYNDYANPRNVVAGESSNHDGYHDLLVAAFRKDIELQAGEKVTLRLLGGVSKSPEQRRMLIDKYSSAETVGVELERLAAHWADKLSQVVVTTPDDAINLYANIWLKNAIVQCNTWVRGPTSNSCSGYRDVMQDARGIVMFDPPRTRRAILTAMPYQYADGSALRQWAANPEHHDRRRFADSPLWISFTLCAYIRQTGDTDLLEIKKPYLDQGADTVYAHMLAGLRRISTDIGAHGLPLIHEGDWNDGIGLIGPAGRGESVWLAMAVIAANTEAAELADFIGDQTVRDELLGYNEQLTLAVNGPGWDGQYYRRAFTDEGRIVGTSEDKDIQLWLNPQVWAILSGVADQERTRMIRQAVEERLRTSVGYMIFDPPFADGHRADIGYYSLLLPKKWNYIHGNAMKIAAECKIGLGDAALETLNLLMPLSHDPDKIRSEPYAFPNYYVMADEERWGRSLFGWFTGTCSWVFQSVVEGMLGIQPSYRELIVDPCLPSTWRSAAVEVSLRGARYVVRIHNPNGRNKGVTRTVIDSCEAGSNRVPYFADGRKHTVDVYL